jgi:flagellar hook-associated protein 3 FlgL
MKTTLTSTSAIADAARLTMMKLQSQLADAQTEVSTGRYADVGATLGAKTGQTVSLRQEQTRLQAMMDGNGLVSTRMDATQSVLKAIGDDAQSFLGQLTAAANSNVPGVLQGEAKSSLAGLIDSLNTQVGGAYLFAGTNADVKPVAQYDQTPPGTNKQGVADAFSAAFGFSQSDPQVAGISADAMQSFLDGPFADMFSDSGWKSTWSSASDQNVRSRISTSELIDTSANANDDAVRKLASAYTMVADLGTSNLSDGAYQKVIAKATQLTAEAVQGLTALQSNLGAAQQRVTDANSRMSIQSDIMTKHISALEGVDPYEASSRLSALMTQVETAYAMTARIEKLTLLNYLTP